MIASDYPITFGYGATDGYYYGPNGIIGAYHRGDDRAMPDGTPVVVNGVVIGLSNNTGASSGPHLHIGRFVNGKDTNPNGGGFEFDSAVVTEVNQDSVNGKYVRIKADGASWIYLHLLEQRVTVGQVLKGGDMPTPEFIRAAYDVVLREVPSDEQVNAQMGQPADINVIESLKQDQEAKFVPKGDFDNVFSIADQRLKNEKAVADLVGVGNPDDTDSIVNAINDLKAKAGPSVIPPENPSPQPDPTPPPPTQPPVDPLPPKKTLGDAFRAFWKAFFG